MNAERRKKLNKVVEELEALKAVIEFIREEEEEAYDNMPEGLQGSEKGEAMENAIGSLEQAESGIEEATESISEAVEG